MRPGKQGPAVRAALARITELRDYIAELEAQIRDLLEEREELLTEIVRLQRGNRPAGRVLRGVEAREWIARRDACEDRDAEHEGGGGA